MRRAIGPLVVAFALVASGCDKVEQYQKSDKAKTRVSGVLDGIQKGGTDTTPEVQRAMCLWYADKVALDFGTLSKASDLFLVWQNEGHIARKIARFEVTKADPDPTGAMLVSGTIEGKPFVMKCPPGAPITWVKPPAL